MDREEAVSVGVLYFIIIDGEHAKYYIYYLVYKAYKALIGSVFLPTGGNRHERAHHLICSCQRSGLGWASL